MNDSTVDSAWRLHRKRVLDVCYRVLGTLADAEDAVSETFARLTRSGTERIDDVEGWLVTVAGRVCLDRLRADRARSRYVGPWLPEPLIDSGGTEPDPADRVTLDDSADFRVAGVNGQPGVVVSLSGRVMAVIGLETDGHQVHAIRAVGNPEKLAHLNHSA